MTLRVTRSRKLQIHSFNILTEVLYPLWHRREMNPGDV